jgi:hypothetical protein
MIMKLNIITKKAFPYNFSQFTFLFCKRSSGMESTKAKNGNQKNSNIAIHWIEKNCCLHPDHDLKNAVLYLNALSLAPALSLLQTIRKSSEIKHTCRGNTVGEYPYSPLPN